MDIEKCNNIIYSKGEFFEMNTMSKTEANRYCLLKTKNKDDNYLYDWHYVGGRVRVLRLDRDSPFLKMEK